MGKAVQMEELEICYDTFEKLQQVVALRTPGKLGEAVDKLITTNELDNLQRRLDRVRSWGGDFGQVDLSPDIKEIMADRAQVGMGRRRTVAAL